MWCVWVLLGALCSVDCYSSNSYTPHEINERLAYGRSLVIKLPKDMEKLEFSPSENPTQTYLVWERRRGRTERGHVSGSGSDRRWTLSHVTFDDQGTYTQLDFFDKRHTVTRVLVTTWFKFPKCVAGEALSISLEGVSKLDVSLTFSGAGENVTLVQDGSPVAENHPDFAGRVQVKTSSIQVSHVNVSDVGLYTLRDRRGRTVSVSKLIIVEQHEVMEGNPLLALLLLLGIPAGICCCCRKKIFKKKEPVMTTASPVVAHSPASPPPGYNTPTPAPGPVFYHNSGPQPAPHAGYTPGYNAPDPNVGFAGYPSPGHPPTQPGYGGGPPVMPPNLGFHPGYHPQHPQGYTPQDPLYPPLMAAGMPPQNPQWNGPPPGQYPAAAPGYAPVMYSAPPPSASEPVKEEIKMQEISPAAPLLTPPQADSGVHYNIDGGKNSSTNFL